MQKIKYLVMDVDGTLTDGKIYMGQAGEAFKAFNIKDGCGIKEILPQHNIIPIVITARQSQILEKRCKEIGISEIHQGFRQKFQKLNEVVSGDLGTVAYIGDDIPDIPCMEAVKKAGGLVLCPADAISEIKSFADYISGNRAGDGAVRDCINYLIRYNTPPFLEERIQAIVELILAGDFTDRQSGILKDGSNFTIQEYITKNDSECVIESHRNHIDIQYMIEGHEKFKTYMPSSLINTGYYNSDKDVECWENGIVSTCSLLVPGSLIVVHNGQPHKGAIQWKRSEKVRKLICKIDINNSTF